MIGIDTASLDHGPSKNYTVHQLLLSKNIPFLEMVAHLDKLAAAIKDDHHGKKMIEVTALPMKIIKGSGGPIRIMATVSTMTNSTFRVFETASWLLILCSLYANAF